MTVIREIVTTERFYVLFYRSYIRLLCLFQTLLISHVRFTEYKCLSPTQLLHLLFLGLPGTREHEQRKFSNFPHQGQPVLPSLVNGHRDVQQTRYTVSITFKYHFN